MENTREVINLDGLSIERLSDNVYLARIHDIGCAYGSPWKSSMILVVSGNVCEVMAMQSAIDDSRRRELINYFSALGVEFIIFDRIKNGKMIKLKIKI